MFWKKKTNKKNKKPQTREAIIAQAKESAAKAREEIGDETLEKIKRAMEKRQNSALEQARQKIKNMDEDHVRDNLSLWLRDKE